MGLPLGDKYRAPIFDPLNVRIRQLEDELKETKRVLKGCQEYNVIRLNMENRLIKEEEEDKVKIKILEAKLEAKERAKSKKICPILYAGSHGGSFCKREECAIWEKITATCGLMTEGFLKAHAKRLEERFE